MYMYIYIFIEDILAGESVLYLILYIKYAIGNYLLSSAPFKVS